MSPDGRALIPFPGCCQSCAHRVSYLRSDGDRMIERQECAHPFGVLPHPGCSWHTPRVIPMGVEYEESKHDPA